MQAVRNGGALGHVELQNATVRQEGMEFLLVAKLSVRQSSSSSSCGLTGAQSEDLFVLAMDALTGVVSTAMSISMSNMAGGAPGVTMACIPLFFPTRWFGTLQNEQGDAGASPEVNAEDRELQLSARRCEHSQTVLFATCAAQALAAACSFVTHDSLSGFIGLGISFLGVQAATLSGQRFLPSYVVLSFCNGTMQILLAAELTSHASLRLAASRSLLMKAASVACLATPALMFAGMFFGWQLFKELRILRALAGVPQNEVISSLDFGGSNEDVATASVPSGAAASSQRQASSQSSSFRPFAGNHYRLSEIPGKKENSTAAEERLAQDLSATAEV